jgi:P pilus assembly chaperone PapD
VAASAVRASFVVDPTVLTISAAAGEKTGSVTVKNTGNIPVAVELTVYERKLDLDGELDRTDLLPCKDFTVYPSEIILHPNREFYVQLRYAGKEKIKEDRSYSLFSKEVLIPVEEEESDGVDIKLPTVMSYYTIINFETGKEGKLTYISSKALKDDKIELIAENRSGGRVVTRNLAIKTDTVIIKSFTGTKNSIMPGQKRRFTFKYVRPLTSREVKFIYDYNESD